MTLGNVGLASERQPLATSVVKGKKIIPDDPIDGLKLKLPTNLNLRKRRCNGERPLCSNCQAASVECVYIDVEQRRYFIFEEL